MGKWVVVAATLLLAGCGKSPISAGEAREIAELSQDSDKYLDGFTGAIRELSGEKGCQVDFMRDSGGFSRSSFGDYYFIHCGTLYSDTNYQTWYYDADSDKLARVKAAL